MGELLKVSNLSINYENAAEPVVEHFNLSLKAGEMLAIVGESGCGKTSVIRAIMNILPNLGKVTCGEIIFDNISMTDNKKYKTGEDISFVFQSSGSMLDPVYTIGEQYIEYIRSHTNVTKKEAHKLAVETLKKAQLEDAEGVMHTYPFELSGGMQQRVGIAMAITFNPKLILADEPTSALDVTTQIQIVDLLKKINQEYNTAMIIVTHNLGVASYLADRCLVMLDGKIVEQGAMSAIINNPQNEYTKKLINATVLKED